MLVNIIQNTISSFRSALAAAEVITTNLKIWLGFKTSSVVGDNQITPDKSGNNNVGKLFTGKALDFDGTGDYVDISGFSMSGNNATFAFWAYIRDNLTSEYFFDFHSDTTRFVFGFGQTNQKLAVYSGGWQDFGDPPQDQWVRIVLTIKGTIAKCFVDGVQLGTDKTISTYDFSSPTTARIGSRYEPFPTNAKFYNGILSDLQVYDRIWLNEDVAYDYANPQNLVIDRDNTKISISNFKAYWAMSEGAGSIAYDSGTKLGAEQIVDGDFPTGTTAWVKGSDTTIGNNEASFDGTASYVSQNILVIGKVYECSVRVKTWVSGAALAVGTAATGGGTVYKEITRANNTTTTFTFTAVSTTLGVGSKSFDVEGSIDLVSVKEVISSNNDATINGATYVDAQPRIPQLGMMNWSKSTPVANEITLIPNPNNTSQDILGNAVRDRLNSFNLDGSGYAEVAEVAGLDVTDFSIEAWVKFDYTDSGSSTNVIYVNGGVSTSVNTFALATDEDNKVRFIVGNVNIYSTTVFSNNNWVHIVGTRKLGALKLYINGNKTPEATGTGNAVVNNTLDLLVGRDTQANRFYKERISDVRLYGSALSADEVENNYNAGLSAHRN